MKFIKQYWSNIFFVIGLLALILGLWGFGAFSNFSLSMILTCQGWKNIVAEQNLAIFFKAALNTAQMYVINLSSEVFFESGHFKNWQVAGAAFLAPLSTIGALLGAFGYKFGHWFNLHIKSYWPIDYVFIGGGRTAVGIAARLHRQAEKIGKSLKVVGLDNSPENALAYLINSRNLNGFIHIGDCFVDADIASLKLRKAKNIFVSIGTDLENIEAARRIINSIKHSIKDKVRLYVHVRDHHLMRSREILFSDLDSKKIALELISIDRMAARSILTEFPPKLVGKNTAPHILIVGNSELATYILIHAVQHLVYSTTQPLKITWAGSGVADKLQTLRMKFIGLSETNDDPAIQALLPLVKIHTIDCDADELCPQKWREAQDNNNPFNIAYVACPEDDMTYTTSIRVATLREIGFKIESTMPILACFQDSQGSLSDLIDRQISENSQHFLPLPKKEQIEDLFGINIFNMIVILSESYFGESKDTRAMLLNGIYSQADKVKQPDNKYIAASDEEFITKSKKLWQDDIEKGVYRWSSQLCADHIQIKLQCILSDEYQICKLMNDEAALKEAIDQNVTKLAELEHRRYIAERLMEGWLPINIRNTEMAENPEFNYKKNSYKKIQKDLLTLNYTLVPFNRLKEIDAQKKLELDEFGKPKQQTSEIEKDYQIVKSIPQILRCEAKV